MSFLWFNVLFSIMFFKGMYLSPFKIVSINAIFCCQLAFIIIMDDIPVALYCFRCMASERDIVVPFTNGFVFGHHLW